MLDPPLHNQIICSSSMTQRARPGKNQIVCQIDQMSRTSEKPKVLPKLPSSDLHDIYDPIVL